MNQITSFLDSSQVYGSEMSTSRSLRLGRRGRLRVTRIESEDLLPLAPDECADFTKQQYCFAAGKYSLSILRRPLRFSGISQLI